MRFVSLWIINRNWWLVKVTFSGWFQFFDIEISGSWWGPMNAFCCSVNVDWVVILLEGGGYTSKLRVIAELTHTLMTLTRCTLMPLAPLNLHALLLHTFAFVPLFKFYFECIVIFLITQVILSSWSQVHTDLWFPCFIFVHLIFWTKDISFTTPFILYKAYLCFLWCIHPHQAA